ncbi:MAG: hypothetical protein HC893_15540, partial [Chloroflexaceae bacterium]|nr:hypothetical protein [Chloroflexaceae bacterium]
VGHFSLNGYTSGGVGIVQTAYTMTMTIDLTALYTPLASAGTLTPVIYAYTGTAWVRAETYCTLKGCYQQVADNRAVLTLDYFGEFAVGIAPYQMFLPRVLR